MVRCQTQCREGHSRHESGQAGNTLQIGTFYTDTSNSNGWAEAAARVCRTLTEADGSSLNKQWFELIRVNLHNIHSAATWRQWHNNKKAWSANSLDTEYTWRSGAEDDIQQQHLHKDCKNKCILTTKHREVITKTRFTNLKIPILWETLETIRRTWSSKVRLLSNFTPRISGLELAQMETPDETKSPSRAFTVLYLQTTKAVVLIGFSVVHQWLHHSWILVKTLLWEAATAGHSAGWRITVSNVESSELAYSWFCTSSNISLV